MTVIVIVTVLTEDRDFREEDPAEGHLVVVRVSPAAAQAAQAVAPVEGRVAPVARAAGRLEAALVVLAGDRLEAGRADAATAADSAADGKTRGGGVNVTRRLMSFKR